MGTCFVIQPFDKGKFDKRFRDCFSPAIRKAGFEPYRVDQDAGVNVPIDAIHEGIQKSEVCLVDITTDNPNVWYELGYATSAGKPIIMVCSSERTTPFPFDVRHRAITPYSTESASDFEALKDDIVKRLKAIAVSAERIKETLTQSPVLPEHGLKPYEIAILSFLLENHLTPNSSVSPEEVQNVVTQYGYSKVAVSLGLHSLKTKVLIQLTAREDHNGYSWQEYSLSDKSVQWALENESRFAMKAPQGGYKPVTADQYDPFADE